MTPSLHFTRPGVRIDLRVSHRLRRSGTVEGGDLMLFFGARTQQELPCFSLLQSLPKDFIDSNFAFSRTPGEPKHYVQDLMRERAPTWPRC